MDGNVCDGMHIQSIDSIVNINVIHSCNISHQLMQKRKFLHAQPIGGYFSTRFRGEKKYFKALVPLRRKLRRFWRLVMKKIFCMVGSKTRFSVEVYPPDRVKFSASPQLKNLFKHMC